MSRQAASSARLLLNSGDTSGACNREYYAMFDAARAALMIYGAQASEVSKTHSGLIHAFSQASFKPGLVPKELGQSLARAHELRFASDYTGNQVQAIDAQTAVGQAEQFIAILKTSQTGGAAQSPAGPPDSQHQ